MGTNGPWNWRLLVPKIAEVMLVRPVWRRLLEMTVLLPHVACTPSAHPQLSLWKLSPPACHGHGLGPWTDVRHPPPTLLTSEIKQTFLSTNLAVYWLLSSEQPDPTHPFNNNTRTCSSRTRGRTQLPWLHHSSLYLERKKKKDIKCIGIKFWGCVANLETYF